MNFADDYEKITENGVTKQLYYIQGGDGLAAVYVKQSGQTDQIYYAHTDHLGSILSLTDANGTVVFKAIYDAWGNQKVTNNLFPFHRGYTGHEHLREFNLIDMNGRMYDPALGRFLSPDPFVQMPDFSQNFNRYSYCLNNPLKYTDPNGEFIFSILAAIFCPPLLPTAIGVDIGMWSGGIRGIMTPGMNFWDGAWRGGIVGAVGGGLSMFGGGRLLANVAWGMGEGAITGGLDAALWGQNIGKRMLNGAAIGGAFAATTSGIEAYSNYKDGYGFRTNDDVINKLVKDANVNGSIDPIAAQRSINFVQSRYDLIGANMRYNRALDAYGAASLNGKIEIGSAAFESSSMLKATMIHEYTHSLSDRILVNGRWRWNLEDPAPWNYNDGIRAYLSEILNSGKMHIGIKALKMLNADDSYANPVWYQIGIRKYWHTIPIRF